MDAMRAGIVGSVIIATVGGIVVAPYVQEQLMPCRSPLTYHIETVDKRFNVSQADARRAVSDAVALWENASGHDLFQEANDGTVAVRFVYDERQKVGQQLKDLGLKLDGSRKTYEQLEARYNQQRALFERESASFKSMLADYDRRRQDYDREVADINARGATEQDAKRIADERKTLLSDAEKLQGKQAYINNLVKEVNVLAEQLNTMAPAINDDIETFNTVGSERGDEFEAGNYVRDADGRRIDVFVIDDQAQFTRILTHEFGHALGIPHVADEGAVMYRLNIGKDLALKPADIAALDEACGFEPGATAR